MNHFFNVICSLILLANTNLLSGSKRYEALTEAPGGPAMSTPASPTSSNLHIDIPPHSAPLIKIIPASPKFNDPKISAASLPHQDENPAPCTNIKNASSRLMRECFDYRNKTCRFIWCLGACMLGAALLGMHYKPMHSVDKPNNTTMIAPRNSTALAQQIYSRVELSNTFLNHHGNIYQQIILQKITHVLQCASINQEEIKSDDTKSAISHTTISKRPAAHSRKRSDQN